ncbi:MAG TPA: hypothetical protein PLV58_03550 [Campylobacterales bacterium]|nr:hypothetical protein [Campylobacterales bacterium]
MRAIRLITPIILAYILSGCGSEGDSSIASFLIDEPTVDIKSRVLYNESAYIPSQCYTTTCDIPSQCYTATNQYYATAKDANGQTYNPCYSCHRDSIEPNYVDDGGLQEESSFALLSTKNHWTNLFADNSAEIAKISNNEIGSYVSTDNYKTNGVITLAEKLKNLQSNWDIDGDKKWNGYVPDCYFSFDEDGFDKDQKGAYTGWRAFAYYPFLGTFWPTNGSTDDVLIRLQDTFQKDEKGVFDKEVYKTNLAIVEALIRKKDININQIDESRFGVDLDGDGKINITSKIKYSYETGKTSSMSYVGYAKKALANGSVNLAGGLFPVGTEFLHSVRYIDASKSPVGMAKRMKELRYAKKTEWLGYEKLAIIAGGAVREKQADQNALESFSGDAERGLRSRGGWVYQGFIEDARGELRPQNYEETLFCMGCHGGIGATTDTIFAFARKFDAADSWYHWSKKGLQGIAEPKNVDGLAEYSRYLANNRAGDEFGANDEILSKFFDQKGALKESEVAKIKDDISYLLLPSMERAIKLNKAYRVIVKKQSYIYGRDTVLAPVKNVNKNVVQNAPTGLTAIR